MTTNGPNIGKSDTGRGKRIDAPTGTETVGHEWDGIEELNTPLPRWWLWTFFLTIIFAIGYAISYPAWPLLERATTGVLGWSSRGELAKDMAAANAAQQGLFSQIAATDVTNLRDDPELFRKAVAGGAAAFKLHCSQCHGSGAAGSRNLGFPNLNDDDWLWGGDLESIHYTIDHGIRQPEHDETRQSQMPTFDGMFDASQLDALAQHVLSLSGKAAPNAAGAQIFADNCLACHGAAGEGNRTLGAPKLNDAIWLRGDTSTAIIQQVRHPKMGAMPSWGDRLDPVTVKMLTAYIHSLGGGEETPKADTAAAADEVGTGDQQP